MFFFLICYFSFYRNEDAPSRGPLSQKQAEYFLARQAYLLKNDENKALKPSALQDELNNMLKFNPDFAEAVRLYYQLILWTHSNKPDRKFVWSIKKVSV